jgi:hypothetical protein
MFAWPWRPGRAVLCKTTKTLRNITISAVASLSVRVQISIILASMHLSGSTAGLSSASTDDGGDGIVRPVIWTCPFAQNNLKSLSSTSLHPEIVAMDISPFLTWDSPVEGALFVFGGRSGRLGDSRQYLRSVEYLDPTDLVWRPAPDMRHPRVGLAATFLDNHYYVIGGYNCAGDEDPQRSVEKLDVNSMVWRDCAPLLVPRYGHSACTCRGQIYVMGGDHSGVLVPYAERYDPTANTWERLPDMPIRVAASRALCLDDKVYVFGGCDPSVPGDRASDAILVFDPDSLRWSVLGRKMSLGRTAFSIAPTRDGAIIAGGFDLSARPEIEMDSVEVISGLTKGEEMTDIAPERPPCVPALPHPRAGCQGVFLPIAHLPVSMDNASTLPIIVLGGEHVDPMTGRCKIYDNVTMLVNTGFDKQIGDPRNRKERRSNIVKRVFATSVDKPEDTNNTHHTLVWSDNVIPAMRHSRTAFAACVGPVWPSGYPQVDPKRKASSESTRSRTSSWTNLLQEWIQGNVF